MEGGLPDVVSRLRDTPDGRKYSQLTWHDHVLVGTIDVAVGHSEREPTPIDEEIGLSLYSLRSVEGTSYS